MIRILLTLVCLVQIQFCVAQYTFSGRVVNEESQPLRGAVVTVGVNRSMAVTDSTGLFSFSYNSQQFFLSVSHVGYQPFGLRITDKFPGIIRLTRDPGLLEETVVHAFERNASLKNVAAAVTVIDKNLLEKFAGHSLVAAINSTPGVKMDERSPGSYRLSVRGNLLRSTFGVRNVKVYWNNIPFTDASGNTFLNLLPANILQRIEVIKGPSGSMYGSGTGGVLLIGSGAAPGDKEKSIQLQLAGGSYGYLSGSVSFQKTGPSNSTASFSHQQTDGYRTHTNMRRDVLHYSGTSILTGKQKLHSNIFLADLFYQTPGGLTLAEMQVNPKQARPAAGVFRGADAQQAAVYLKTLYTGLSLESRLSETWSNTTGAYLSFTDFKNPTIRNYENKYDKGVGGRTVFNYRKKNLHAVIGAEFQSGFFYAAVHGNQLGRKDTLQFQDALQSRQANIFFQGDIALPAGFLLSGGLSYNRFYYGFQRESDSNSAKQTSSFTPQLVPRISLLKKIKVLSLYTSVSKGYSVPGIDEVHAGNDVFNTSLKSEIAINYEAGVKTEFIRNKLWMDLSWYIFSLQNTIVGRRDAAGGDFYTNAGKTRQKGLEMAIAWQPVNKSHGFFRQVKLNTSFTNIEARFRDYQQGVNKFDGNQLTGTPPNVLTAGVDILSAIGLYFNAHYNYTDHTPLNDANSFWGTSYQLLFAKVGYGIPMGLLDSHIFLSYEKALQNPYSLGNDLNAAGGRFYNPSPPQQFTAGIQLKFKVKDASRAK
jgi:iron complex outermembrane receptor protein